MRKVWVVVADAAFAKFYKAENVKTLNEFNTLTHKESRLPNHDLCSDRPGRATELRGGAPHMMQREFSPKLKEKDHFATEIAKVLEQGLIDGEYERLYLIANVQFATLLRHHLSPNVEKMITAEIHKDLTEKKAEEIRDYLPPVL